MANEIRALRPVYASWLEAWALGEIAEVMARPMETASPKEVTLAEREQLAKELAAAEAVGDPATAAALRRAFAQYSHELGVVGREGHRRRTVCHGGRSGARDPVPGHQASGQDPEQRGHEGDGQVARLLCRVQPALMPDSVSPRPSRSGRWQDSRPGSALHCAATSPFGSPRG